MIKMELFGNVGESITVDQIRLFLNSHRSESVQFEISSLGGDLATGLTIHDLIKAHPQPTSANIIGLTASAGTVIAEACDEIEISDNALFLIHNGWTEKTGNVFDFQKAASDLMKTDAIMVKIYRDRTGLADEKIKDLMKASDWLSPDEALAYGFVDRITPSGTKIAASAMLAEAQNAKINGELLTKLKEKMKLFGKDTKAKAEIVNILALKDGKSVLINAAEPATGVEVAPLGAMTLEDGTFELADGRKIVVAGGVITEVVEVEAAAPADAAALDTEAVVAAVVAAVTPIVTAEIDKVKADFKAELGKISSTHQPAKGAGIVTPGKAKAEAPGSLAQKVADEIKAKIDASRKA